MMNSFKRLTENIKKNWKNEIIKTAHTKIAIKIAMVIC